MRLLILGSAGTMPTPRPLCQCRVCRRVRKMGGIGKRNSSSMYLPGEAALFDCPEDIGDSLNRWNVKGVKHLFLTHWHPDHTFGLRPLLEAGFAFRKERPNRKIKIHVSKAVLKDIVGHYPIVKYLIGTLKVGQVEFMEHGQSVRLGRTKITAIGFQGSKSKTFGYLIESRNKRAFYAPCDTLGLGRYEPQLDLLVHESGLMFYNGKTEISFPELVERLRIVKPKRTILTHIEEIDLQLGGPNILDKMVKKYQDVPFDFAYDGMKIDI